MAVVKDGMSKMRWKTENDRPWSVTTESTSSTASGYRIKSVRSAMSTTIVVTMMGSPKNFARSSSAPCFVLAFAMRRLTSNRDKRGLGDDLCRLAPYATYLR